MDVRPRIIKFTATVFGVHQPVCAGASRPLLVAPRCPAVNHRQRVIFQNRKLDGQENRDEHDNNPVFHNEEAERNDEYPEERLSHHE